MKQKKSQIYLLPLLVIIVFFTLPLKAQVNIGSLDKPHPFSILELTTTEKNHGGLRMPQLDNDERATVQAKFNETTATAEAAKGLIIYNTETGCLEFWNGKEWISLCSDVLPVLEVDPASLFFAYNDSGTGKSQTVTVTTNQPDWSITSPFPSWFTADRLGNTLTVTILNDNTGSASRAGSIAITAGTLTQTIFITQGIDFSSFTDGGTSVANRTYIGAFWKHNQTGERIIRIQGITAANAGAWTASVGWYDSQWNPAAGDGIVFSAIGTSDKGVTFDASENPGNAESYPVTNDSAFVSGTVAANGTIMFRIGLQKQFTAYMPDDDPVPNPARYAVVMLSFNDGAKVQKLFIRQGEGADYLMRGNDPVGDASDVATRTANQCMRFSPYNLTATTLDGPVETNGGIWTDYPSQTGAFFQWANTTNVRWAYNAWQATVAAGTWDSNSPSGYWNTGNETCPSGYRRPTDGITTGNDTGPTMTLSEMRQSLFLSPKMGNGTRGSNNSVWGYYADGFFDRRFLKLPAGGSYVASVSIDNNQIAHFGCLLYNPYSNASLFFPAAGCRRNTDSAMNLVGDYGIYWSSSTNNLSASGTWALNVALGTGSYMGSSYNNRSYGYSIRCVKDN